jgi:hypothetical protein
MQIHFSDEPIDYDGTQLTPHWIYKKFGLLGDSLVSFVGGCDVKIEKMVDLVDVTDNKPIWSGKMLHFIGEFFDTDLVRTILMERLLVSLAQQEIVCRTGKKQTLVRGGNDLYDDGAKLSVAIATASPVSTLIHFGINISSKGTPVKTKGLEEYDIEPASFAHALMESFRDEIKTVMEARSKVKAVY